MTSTINSEEPSVSEDEINAAALEMAEFLFDMYQKEVHARNSKSDEPTVPSRSQKPLS